MLFISQIMAKRGNVLYSLFGWIYESSGGSNIPPACHSELVEANARARSGDFYSTSDSNSFSRGGFGIGQRDDEQ